MGPNRGASFRQGPGCPCAPSRKHALSAARFHWPVPPPSMWPSWRSPQPARRGVASSWSLRLWPTCQRGSVHIWGVRSHHGAPHPLFHPSHLVPDEPTHPCSTEQTGGETPRHKTGPPVSLHLRGGQTWEVLPTYLSQVRGGDRDLGHWEHKTSECPQNEKCRNAAEATECQKPTRIHSVDPLLLEPIANGPAGSPWPSTPLSCPAGAPTG